MDKKQSPGKLMKAGKVVERILRKAVGSSCFLIFQAGEVKMLIITSAFKREIFVAPICQILFLNFHSQNLKKIINSLQIAAKKVRNLSPSLRKLNGCSPASAGGIFVLISIRIEDLAKHLLNQPSQILFIKDLSRRKLLR